MASPFGRIITTDWTPSASTSITINNPEAFGKLSKGHEFYVDFIPVQPAA